MFTIKISFVSILQCIFFAPYWRMVSVLVLRCTAEISAHTVFLPLDIKSSYWLYVFHFTLNTVSISHDCVISRTHIPQSTSLVDKTIWLHVLLKLFRWFPEISKRRDLIFSPQVNMVNLKVCELLKVEYIKVTVVLRNIWNLL